MYGRILRSAGLQIGLELYFTKKLRKLRCIAGSQGKLIEESKKMVEDTRVRMGKEAMDLRDLVVRYSTREAIVLHTDELP